MNYIEVKFACVPNDEIVNSILPSLLGEIGFESFTESQDGVLAYIQKDLFSKDNIDELIRQFPLKCEITYSHSEVEERNWNEEWEKHYFEPLIIDNRCIIQSTFHNVPPTYEYNIIIDPKMSFGTGHHQTTELMIREILKEDFKGKAVLDMGCGTAIIAILAAMRGASPITAIDIDQWAYDNALENIDLNNVSGISVHIGDADLLLSLNKTFDIILANINRNILLNDIRTYASVLNTGGLLFMSGFYTEDIPMIEAQCKKNRLTLSYSTSKNNWACTRFIKE